ncbi:MAG: pantetheine-phosphate adenylyltransferase [Clostridia bacterium]|nr:pantetheine-phosphate adenylyltransferase [Clostridia bacterium]
MEKTPQKILVAGSFDPVTKGHITLIDYAAKHYEQVYAVIFINAEKTYYFSLEERLALLRAACAEYANVTVDFCNGMQYEYAQEHGITRALRGYRNEQDLRYEKIVADFNENAPWRLETQMLACEEELRQVSSTKIRELLALGGDFGGLVPENTIPLLKKMAKEKQR